MFNLKKLKFLQFLIGRKPFQGRSEKPNPEQIDEKLSKNLKKDLEVLKNTLADSSDLIYHNFTAGIPGRPEAVLIVIDGMVENAIVNNSIIKPLMLEGRFIEKPEKESTYTIDDIKKNLIAVGDIKTITTFAQVIDGVLNGNSVLLVQGLKEGLVIGTPGFNIRGISEPATDVVVRGPREGFTEAIRVNTSMIRRRVKNPDLTFENFIVGQRTRTFVTIAYIKNIVKPGLVEEIKKRLDRINTDGILESGYIEQFIEDAPFSPFSTIGNTERPDVVAAKILEGRAAIIVDGTPIILTVPLLFIESFQSAEDYYSRPFYAGIVRILRFVAFLISIFGPGVYVALISYHQELIPTPLILTMVAARQGVPFPVAFEALLMGVTFEILREAGIRLPRPVGTAISIVGALVIGDAVVSAGIISATMIVVVALTAIASFVVPPQADIGSLARIMMVALGSTLGLFGIMLGFLGGLIHMCTLKSFGTPYLGPIAPFKPLDWKDVLVRFPIWTMITRPMSIGPSDLQREEIGLMPKPAKEDDRHK